MGHFTYKVFSLYFSIRCGTYNSHLHTTLPPQVWVHQFITFIFLSDVGHITHSCTKHPPHPHPPTNVSPSIQFVVPSSSESSYLLVSSLLLSPQRIGCLGHTLRWTRALIPLLGHWGEPRGPPTSSPKQLHKWERRHTLTQNFKTMGLWVLFLIRCSTFTFLSDVGHITHTCTHNTPPQVWVICPISDRKVNVV